MIATGMPKAIFFTSDRFRGHHYSGNHPLAIPRVALTEDVITACSGFLPGSRCKVGPAALPDLIRFHHPDYLEALRQYDIAGPISPADRQRFNIGNFENPWFHGMYTVPATAANGSILGARAVIGGQAAFNPAGGMHHAVPGRARGFCYVNDVALAVMVLRDAGCRVLVVDLDAHHGDGVEAAFAQDPAVVVFSIHMDTALAYPRRGGRISDINPAGNSVNCPLPIGINDSEYLWVVESLWHPLLETVRPDAVVLVVGADVLAGDPLGKFKVSNHAALAAVATIVQTAPRHPGGGPRVLALGGGGYHPVALARYWAGVWSILSGIPLPEQLPPEAHALLAVHQDDGEQLYCVSARMLNRRVDAPRSGSIRDEVRHSVQSLLADHPLRLTAHM